MASGLESLAKLTLRKMEMRLAVLRIDPETHRMKAQGY